MALLQLNIGLNVEGVETLDAAQVVSHTDAWLKPFIVGPSIYAVGGAASGEQTVTASLLVAPIPCRELTYMINRLCCALEQDCIAVIYNGEGLLIGPKAADWGGAFNADYWLPTPALNQWVVDARTLIDAYDEAIHGLDFSLRPAVNRKVNEIRAKIQALR